MYGVEAEAVVHLYNREKKKVLYTDLYSLQGCFRVWTKVHTAEFC